MPTSLADYSVIRDSKLTLRADQHETVTCNAPADIVRTEESPHTSKRPILAFFADPSGNAENLRCTIEINDREVFNYSYSGGVGRAHYEVIRHEDVVVDRNTIQFRCLSGEGSISFSDIILWYQRFV